MFESSGILQGEAEAGEKGVLVDGNAAGMVTERREEQTRSADEGEVSGNSGFSSDILPKLLQACLPETLCFARIAGALVVVQQYATWRATGIQTIASTLPEL